VCAISKLYKFVAKHHVKPFFTFPFVTDLIPT